MTPQLAAVLASGEPERLYSGLSLLVSTAADGTPSAALATFRALELLVEPGLPARTSPAGERFAASFGELVATARALETLRLYACSASLETSSVSRADAERLLDGVMSTPRFLRETSDARLIFV